MQLALDPSPSSAVGEPVEVAARLRADEGAHRRGREALELAELREDVGARRHERVGHLLAHDRRRAALVLGVEVREQEADGDRLDALLAELPRGGAHLVLVERHEHLAGRRHDPLGHDLAVAAPDERPRLPRDVLHHRVVQRPLVPADVDDVPEAARRDHPREGALVLEHGVRRHGRAVEDAGHVRRREAGVGAELGEAADHRLLRLGRRGGHLVDVHGARLRVVEHEVRERASDVDADDAHDHLSVPGSPKGRGEDPHPQLDVRRASCTPRASG